jgi:hypothetical protein
MKKRALMVCSVCLLSLTAIGQEAANPTHTTPATVLATPSLKMQAEKIQQKELQLSHAGTSSRAIYTQLKEELNTLNNEYKVMLSKEIALTANDAVRLELETELKYVEQQLAPVTNQR